MTTKSPSERAEDALGRLEATIPKTDDLLKRIGQKTQSGYILLVWSTIDTWLEELLCLQMPALSKTRREKLFSGYGPFASTATKIDVLHAMNIIASEMRSDLHAIRQVRNMFAHPRLNPNVHLEDTEVVALLQKINGWEQEQGEPLDKFFSKCGTIIAVLTKKAEDFQLVGAIRRREAGRADGDK